MSIPVSTILAGLREHEAETAGRVAKLTHALGAVRRAESAPYGRTVRNRWCLAQVTKQE